MKKTRRAFSLSSLGIGAAFAGSRSAGPPREANEPRTFRLHEDAKFSCFETNLARGRGAEVFATFGRAEPGAEVGDIFLVRSSDGGLSWRNSKPVSLFSIDGPLNGASGYQHAALTHLSDGALLASATRFGFLFDGKVGWRRGSNIDGVYIRASSDGGSSWSELRKVDTLPYRRAWTRGPIVEMPDGSLLLPLAGQQGDGYSGFEQPLVSFVMRSVDRGVSWQYHATIARDSSDFDEPAIARLDGERLLCVLRGHEPQRRDPQGGYLYIAVSPDGGTTWSKPRMTSMWGHPASLLRLEDGRVLCAYGYRMHPNPGVRACLSGDGLNWRPNDIFTVSASPEVDSAHLNIGCPSSVELEPGRILTAYQVWAQTGRPEQAGEGASQRQCLEGTVFRV